MKLGQAKCPYCKQPLSTAIKIYEAHINSCKKNPDNWDDIDGDSKSWIKGMSEDVEGFDKRVKTRITINEDW